MLHGRRWQGWELDIVKEIRAYLHDVDHFRVLVAGDPMDGVVDGAEGRSAARAYDWTMIGSVSRTLCARKTSKMSVFPHFSKVQPILILKHYQESIRRYSTSWGVHDDRAAGVMRFHPSARRCLACGTASDSGFANRSLPPQLHHSVRLDRCAALRPPAKQAVLQHDRGLVLAAEFNWKITLSCPFLPLKLLMKLV